MPDSETDSPERPRRLWYPVPEVGLVNGDDFPDLIFTDLRSGEADTRCGVHRFEHVVDQTLQRARDLIDRLSDGAQHRITECSDGKLRHGLFRVRCGDGEYLRPAGPS